MTKPKLTPAEARLIERIAKRAYQRIQTLSVARYPQSYCGKDIAQVHTRCCPLDLRKLLKAPDFDFLHDVLGIKKHLDRRTGRLRDCFLPRSARP